MRDFAPISPEGVRHNWVPINPDLRLEGHPSSSCLPPLPPWRGTVALGKVISQRRSGDLSSVSGKETVLRPHDGFQNQTRSLGSPSSPGQVFLV